MYNKILIAVDISAEAGLVMKRGKALADLCGADYKVVYCIEEPMAYFGEMEISLPIITAEELKEEMFPHFIQMAAVAGIDQKYISIETGEHAATILHQAEMFGADLIVIGSHARHGLQSLLLGSTSNKVLHHMQCDVLAIRL